MNDSVKVRPQAEKQHKALIVSEVLAGTALVTALLWRGNIRALVRACLLAVVGGARSTITLIFTDPATILVALRVLVILALLLAPLVRAFVLAPRSRLAWVPALGVIWLGVLGTSMPAITGPWMWLILVAVSAGAWFAASRPWVRVLAILPWIVALEPMLGHSPLSAFVWTTERLASHCAVHPGQAPDDFRPEFATTRYYSVTPFDGDRMLLTSERRSFWVRRDANGLHLGAPFRLTGNLWQGCIRDGRVWLGARERICETQPPVAAGAAPVFACHRVPGPSSLGPELDYVDVLCPTDRRSVYVTQLVRGGYIEYDPADGSERWHRVVDGMNLQAVSRADGNIVAINTSRLVVFDPRTERTVDDQPAGTVAMGIDICPRDQSIVVADFAGRIRLFDLRRDGGYRFRAGASLTAPRRVAFSPDCSSIAVTSGDDRHVYIVERDSLEAVRSWRMGPGLRDIVFVDATHVAVADACTMRLLDTAR